MPELDKSNLQSAGNTKFIRLDKKIYFADDPNQVHADIAQKYLNGIDVDDAGFLEKDGNELVPMGGSSTLGIKEKNKGRKETKHILSDLQ